VRFSFAIGVAVLIVAGCASPMDRVTRLSDVELAEDPQTVELAEPASEAEAEQRGGLFARLLQPRTTDPAPRQEAAESVDDAGAEPDAAPGQGERRGGFLSFLRPDPARPGTEQDTTEAPAADDAVTAAAAPAETAGPRETRRGLFGLFGGGRDRAVAADGVEIASLGEDAAAPQSATAPRAGRASRIDPNAPDARQVPPGTMLPYGQVARVCDLPRGAMGREVASYPERRAQYRLYDSAPGNTAPHTFYMTGFPDGCARQFTAALAMFGSPAMHEQLRYGAPAASLPYSDTDKAYEKIKRSICGVGRNKPCGARISQLERHTAFVTVYERFGGNARWATILLHDGRVIAADMKSGG
jgi:hypothetical protein